MLDTVKINHVQHISFTQSRLTDAVSVILSELLSYEHPSKTGGFLLPKGALCAKISTGRDTNDGKAAPPAKGVVICALHTKT